jgi:hypothetical protein
MSMLFYTPRWFVTTLGVYFAAHWALSTHAYRQHWNRGAGFYNYVILSDGRLFRRHRNQLHSLFTDFEDLHDHVSTKCQDTKTVRLVRIAKGAESASFVVQWFPGLVRSCEYEVSRHQDLGSFGLLRLWEVLLGSFGLLRPESTSFVVHWFRGLAWSCEYEVSRHQDC